MPAKTMSGFAHRIMEQKYSHTLPGGKLETWEEIATRVSNAVLNPEFMHLETYQDIRDSIIDKKFIPGGRYLAASGRDYHQVNNCLVYRAEDSREGWANLLKKIAMSLMSGGGVGIDYSGLREKGAVIKRTGGVSSGPLSLMEMVNEVARHAKQGGSRRSAIWAGLSWDHPDIMDFIRMKDWSTWLIERKAIDFSTPAPMDMTNISVILNEDFFDAFYDDKHSEHLHAKNIYYETCKQMFKKSEPGFSINYSNSNESLRNACTEITSEDDSDVCNLGSINLAKIQTLTEFHCIVENATKFLMLGTLYSDIPHEEVSKTRDKNRRIGLGLMGVHEWLLTRGYNYEMNPELSEWLFDYEGITNRVAIEFSEVLGISKPIKTRAIAPTGTIGIIAETTTGIEPLFCSAYKRRYLKGEEWHYEYVIDPTAKRLIEEHGIAEETIEDAYSLARTLQGFEQRIKFQNDVQAYIDQGISSTINLERWGSPSNNEKNVRERADILLKYLPNLRGITCYADGSRGGQPLTPVKYSTAKAHVGNVYVEGMDICDLTQGGSCGS